MSRQRVALVFGGRSGEHEVSVVSARTVARALSRERYEVVPMAIDHQGLWADPATAARALEDSGDRADQILEFAGAHRIDPRLGSETFDVAFPVLHGPFGEDGTIQGLFEMLDLPYVGCGVAASAVCMDKILCKRLLARGGFNTPPWFEVAEHHWREDDGTAIAGCLELGWPLFVKPARLGSSVGISKIHEAEALRPAIEAAFRHDRRVIVEHGVQGREIEVAVLGNENPRASLPGEVIPGHDFYDYADKYLDDDCELLAPAPLNEDQRHRIQDLAVRAYQYLDCAGMARVDLFFDELNDRLWISELNTIPGFTAISMYPRLWTLSGLDLEELVDELIRLALERPTHR